MSPAIALPLGVPIIRVTIEAGGAYLHRGYYQQQRDLGIEILCILSLAGSKLRSCSFLLAMTVTATASI
jgi:hypothetical protein